MPGGIWTIEMPGISRETNAADVHSASLRYLTPGYFEALQIPLVAGRDFGDVDAFG